MQIVADQKRFCGPEFTEREVSSVQGVVETCAGTFRSGWRVVRGALVLPNNKLCGSNIHKKLITPTEAGKVHK